MEEIGRIIAGSDRFLHREITDFTIGITQQCNCRCSYCCYSGEYAGMRKHADNSMSQEIMLDAISFIKNQAHKTDTIIVSFYGGEALVKFSQVIYMIERLYAIFGDRVLFDITTNGLLLTNDTVDRLMQYNIGISVSLDGCKSIHDRNRRNIAGGGTYDQVVSNLLRFKERYPAEYKKRIQLLVTVGGIEDIMEMNKTFPEFAELLGEKPPYIARIYPNFKKGELYEDDMSKMQEFMEEAVIHKQNGQYDFYTIMLDELLKDANKKLNVGSEKIQIRTCLDDMRHIFIDTDGRLYPCEKFDTRHYIGTLQSGIDKKLLYKWSSIFHFRRSVLCKDCEFFEYCSRCLVDLKMSYSENKQMCEEYKKHIELALLYSKKK